MSYRDLPIGRLRRLAYSRQIDLERENLEELNIISYNFQRTLVQPISTLVRRPAFRRPAFRRSAFSVSRPTLINERLIDYSDMPPLEEVTDTYEYLVELPNVVLNLVSDKLIKLSNVSMNYFNDNFCVICQENIQIVPNTKCIMRVLECTHTFHIDCIDKWFTTNKTCPTCKYTFD